MLRRTVFFKIGPFLIMCCVLLVACVSQTSRQNNIYQTNMEYNNSFLCLSNSDDEISDTGGNVDLLNLVYEVKLLSGMESNIFESSYLVSGSIEEPTFATETFSNSPLIVIKVGNKEVTAYKTKIIHDSSNESRTVFLSEDKKTEYQIYSTGTCYSIKSKEQSVLSRYPKDEITERMMLDSIMEFMSSFVDVNEFKDFSVICSTSIIVQTPSAAWQETKDCFYVVPQELNEAETIKYYQFQFNKYFNGYKTSDQIVVRCSPEGDIIYFSYNCSGIDWSEFPLDEENVTNTVRSFLTDAIKPGYKIKEYTLINQMLVYQEKQIKLSLTYELTLEKDDCEIVVLCPMIVTVK